MTTTTGGNVPIMVDEDSCSSSRDLESSGKVNRVTMKWTGPIIMNTPTDKGQEFNVDEEIDSHTSIGSMRHEKTDAPSINNLTTLNEKAVESGNTRAWFGDGAIQWFCGVVETVRTTRFQVSG
jgi:hypothetical protein